MVSAQPCCPFLASHPADRTPLPSAHSMACLLALKRHHDCLSLVSKEVQCGTTNADVYILRARLHNFFQKVEPGGQGKGVALPPAWVPPAHPEMTGGHWAVSQPRSHTPTVWWGPCPLQAEALTRPTLSYLAGWWFHLCARFAPVPGNHQVRDLCHPCPYRSHSPGGMFLSRCHTQ